MSMDNRHIDVLSEGREALAHAVALLFDNAAGGKATHYSQLDGVLTLYWADPKRQDAYPLPSPLNAEATTDLVWRWIEARPPEEVAEKYDDGDVWNERGAFRAWCNMWGHVDHSHEGIGCFQARWAWIGK